VKKGLLVLVAVLAVFVLFGFAVQKAEACHATGDANCEGWWLTIIGPGDGWVLDHVEGETSGTWQPGQTHVDYDVTAYYKKWVVSGYYNYTSRPTTPPVYDCEFTVNIHGHNYDVSEFYNKPTGDSHHCHRIVWGNLTTQQQNNFKAMHGGSGGVSDYNHHIDENPTAHLVTPGGYGSCPVGYEVDPGNQARCRKWTDTSHYIYSNYRFTGTINRPDCYEPCDETVAQTPTVVWGDWSPWAYDPQTGLEKSFRDGVETTVYVDSQNPELVCETRTQDLHEERTREGEYPEGALIPDQTCEPVPGSWKYQVEIPEGADYELVSGALSGVWSNQYTPEDNSAAVPTVVFTWPTGYSQSVTGDVITKSDDCIEDACRKTRMYPQASYIDPNAPDIYWQGPFGMGPGICNVVHPKDEKPPSAERVSVLCSLCPDQYPGGYIYHGTREFYDGYVWKVECKGEEPHYYYMGFLWDKWVRFDFTRDGERCSPRLPGCAEWIHENLSEQ